MLGNIPKYPVHKMAGADNKNMYPHGKEVRRKYPSVTNT